MGGWIDGWMDGEIQMWIDRRMDTQMDGWINKWLEGRVCVSFSRATQVASTQGTVMSDTVNTQ